MRKINKGRALFLACCLATGIATGYQIGAAWLTEYDTTTAYVEVQSKDTMWGIAERYFDRQDRYKHFGEFVHSIATYNGDSRVYAGQVLRVPLEVRK